MRVSTLGNPEDVEVRTGLSSLAVRRERHLVGCWAAVEREMDGLDIISFDGVGHGVDASEDGDGKDRKGQLHREWFYCMCLDD